MVSVAWPGACDPPAVGKSAGCKGATRWARTSVTSLPCSSVPDINIHLRALAYFLFSFYVVLSLAFLTPSRLPASHASPPSKWFVFQDALDRANEVMGSSLTQRDVKIHVVRDVAPNKPMLCLSFLAPDDGASKDTGADTDKAEVPVHDVAGSGATPTLAGAAGADGSAAEITCRSSSSEAVAGDSVTGGTDAAAAAAATGATAAVAADDREEGGGVGDSEGGACKKRPRTAEAPGDGGP